jgi:hypothetical protein
VSDDPAESGIEVLRGDVAVAVNLLSLLILRNGPVVFQEAMLSEVEGMHLIIRRVNDDGACVASLVRSSDIEGAELPPDKKDIN